MARKYKRPRKSSHSTKRSVGQRLRRFLEQVKKHELAISTANTSIESTKLPKEILKSNNRVKEGLIPAKKPRNEEDAATSNDVTIKVEPTVNDEEMTIDVEQPAAVDYGQAPHNEKSSKFKLGPYLMKGRRIVDVGYFITELLNLSAHNESGGCSLGDMSTTMECTKGIVSGFEFKCRVCKFRKVIWTEDPENDLEDMNADAILSTMGLANDLQSMNKYFAKMKLPRFNQHFFRWKYKRLTKVAAVGGESIGDGEEWCGEEDMPSEGEKGEVVIHDSIVIKHEPEEIFSDTECEDLVGRTHMSEIPSPGIEAAFEMDENIAVGSESSSATAERDTEAIETFTTDAGLGRTYSETSQQVTMSGNSKAVAHAQEKSIVSVIKNYRRKPKVDSTFGTPKKGAKQPYVAECISLPESNLSRRVYAYPVEFLVSLSKFVWSPLFFCVDCLEDFSTHALIKAHACKTYSRRILGIPSLTNFQEMLPFAKTKSYFETLKSSMVEKKSHLDLAVSASKEVQRMMILHAQSKKCTVQKIKKYEQVVAKEKATAKTSKGSEVSQAVSCAFSEIQSSLSSEQKAEKLLEGAKRNQINILEAAAEATERECFALVEFVKSLREDKVGSPGEISENQQEHLSRCQEISCSPKQNLL